MVGLAAGVGDPGGDSGGSGDGGEWYQRWYVCVVVNLTHPNFRRVAVEVECVERKAEYSSVGDDCNQRRHQIDLLPRADTVGDDR